MKVSGTSHFTADREEVWRALNDPAVLVRTIPGVQRLEALGDDAYKMTIAAGVGSIKGVYDGEVRLTDQEQPAYPVGRALHLGQQPRRRRLVKLIQECQLRNGRPFGRDDIPGVARAPGR